VYESAPSEQLFPAADLLLLAEFVRSSAKEFMTKRFKAANCFLAVVFLAVPAAPVHAQTTTRSAFPAARSPDAIKNDFDAAIDEYMKAFDHGNALRTAQARAAAAPAMRHAVRKVLAILQEVRTVDPVLGPRLAPAVSEFQTYAVVFGDDEVTSIVHKLAAGAGPAATSAQAVLAMSQYIQADNSDSQLAAIDAFGDALHADPHNAGSFGLVRIFSIMPRPSVQVTAHFISVLRANTRDPFFLQQANDIEYANNLRSMEGKPFAVEGTLLDGSHFSTADWKGKVILVDFWATWCPPCIVELPKVLNFYTMYHSKGLEILGVSADHDEDTLKGFLAANPDLAWPQIFDDPSAGAASPSIHFGVHIFPTMFLIDRKGILREVRLDADFADLIPKLLAEKAD
jgi:thiol-disulfide isomerase/thioredoxin